MQREPAGGGRPTSTTAPRACALAVVAWGLLASGCAPPPGEFGGGAASGSAGAPADGDALLAYEHTVGVELASEAIVPRLQAIQTACRDARFGACTLLEAQQSAGDWPRARVVLRMAPAGIEPMIALAGEDGDAGERSTRTEDLAVAVRDTRTAQDRLARELERLQAFEGRPGLSVADMIALAERMAATEAQIEAAQREAAQQRRRIDTQLLTVDLRARSGAGGRGEVARAVADIGDTLAMGTAWTIRAAAFLLPLGLVLVAAGAGLRTWWRRWRRA